MHWVFILILLSSSDYLGELKKTEERLSQTEQELEHLKQEEGGILQEMEKIEKEEAKQKRKLTQLEKEKKGLRNRIDFLTKDETSTKESVDKLKKHFDEAIILLYSEYYSPPTTNVTLCRQKEENVFYLNEFLRFEESYLDSINTRMDSILKSKNIAQDELGALLALEREEESVRKKILQQKEAKNNLLKNVKNKQGELEKLIEELRRSRDELEQFIKRMASSSVTGEVGSFLWPTRGTVTSKFGTIIDPVYGTKLLNNGIDIRANEGSSVVASYQGIVVYADRFYGYGNIIIIDHENGYHTLYAHLSVINVLNGERVNQGEIIGKVGSTGMVSEPTLHFEIRRDGRSIDPLTLLK